jgi:hypothetical protein
LHSYTIHDEALETRVKLAQGRRFILVLTWRLTEPVLVVVTIARRVAGLKRGPLHPWFDKTWKLSDVEEVT